MGVTSIFFKVVADCGHHEEVALTKCMEYPRELEKVVIGKEVNISKGFSYYKNTKLKGRYLKMSY